MVTYHAKRYFKCWSQVWLRYSLSEPYNFSRQASVLKHLDIVHFIATNGRRSWWRCERISWNRAEAGGTYNLYNIRTFKTVAWLASIIVGGGGSSYTHVISRRKLISNYYLRTWKYEYCPPPPPQLSSWLRNCTLSNSVCFKKKTSLCRIMAMLENYLSRTLKWL